MGFVHLSKSLDSTSGERNDTMTYHDLVKIPYVHLSESQGLYTCQNILKPWFTMISSESPWHLYTCQNPSISPGLGESNDIMIYHDLVRIPWALCTCQNPLILPVWHTMIPWFNLFSKGKVMWPLPVALVDFRVVRIPRGSVHLSESLDSTCRAHNDTMIYPFLKEKLCGYINSPTNHLVDLRLVRIPWTLCTCQNPLILPVGHTMIPWFNLFLKEKWCGPCPSPLWMAQMVGVDTPTLQSSHSCYYP